MEEPKRCDVPIEALLRFRVTGGFIVAVLLTVFLSFVSWRNARRAGQDAHSVSHTHEVMATIQGTSIDVLETVGLILTVGSWMLAFLVIIRGIGICARAQSQPNTLNAELKQRVKESTAALQSGLERTAELTVTNEELEAFTYSVSHDLRAPIRHISGFTKILLEQFRSSLPVEAQGHLQLIDQAAGRMGQMVDEMLKLARLGRQALEVKTTGLSSLVADVVTLMAPETEGRQVEWKVGELPFMECDPILMRQVFQNLISNALKYSRPRSPAVIEIGQTEKEGEKVIFVKDNGVGFDMKYSDKLFGVFQRLRVAEEFEGNGIGLATVERIIKKHGGRVWVDAELDRGATFFFTLGAAEHSAKKAAAAAGASL